MRANNATVNKLQAEDRAAHEWYRFVLSYPPHLVRDYLHRFKLRPTQTVLDPFCGTGTTIVECKRQGIPSVGVEANTMAHFASSVKVDWSPSPSRLVGHAEQIAAKTIEQLAGEGIADGQLPLFAAAGNGKMARRTGPLRTLPAEASALLLRDSISPLPLHKTLTLLDAIKSSASRYQRHELLALCKAVVFSISNLHFGPEVGVTTAKSDAEVVGAWLAEVRTMARDLQELRRLPETSAVVHSADARQLTQVVEPESIDAVVTSPPYPNEKDYTRTTRLESVLMGFLQTKADLRALKQGLVRSNTRGVYKADEDHQWVATNEKINQIADAIEKRRIELGKTSGFERMYGRVTKLYFGGMARHLAELRTVLRRGAQLAYVVGDQASYLRVMIRTGNLLAEIATSLGYEVVRIDLFRTRLATATREQLREEVVVLRWPGVPSRRRRPSRNAGAIT